MTFSLINEQEGCRKEKGEILFLFLTLKFTSKLLDYNLILCWPVCYCICLDHCRNAYSIFFYKLICSLILFGIREMFVTLDTFRNCKEQLIFSEN